MKRKIYETLLSWKNNNIDTPLMLDKLVKLIL